MIRRSLLLLALLGAPLAASRSFAAVPSSASTSRASAAAEEDSALVLVMKTFKAGQRSLKKLIKDPAANQSALLEVLDSMESGAMTALTLDPPPPEGVTGVVLDLFRVGYKRQMAGLLQQILALREATLLHDGAALQVAYDELSAEKKSGHKLYRDF